MVRTLALSVVLFFSLLLSLQQARSQGFSEYESKTEVPEPLFVDLVRGLGSVKGEWEINSLFYHSQGDFNNLHWAPEIEWAFANGSAVELELPMVGSNLRNYKGAFQKRFGPNGRSPTMHGMQIILESDTAFIQNDATLFYILAHRYDYRFSSMSLVGIQGDLEVKRRPEIFINHTFFFNHTEEVDFGLEMNYRSGDASTRMAQIVPQLHLALKSGYKIQSGFGAAETNGIWSPLAVFRLIKEFNSDR